MYQNPLYMLWLERKCGKLKMKTGAVLVFGLGVITTLFKYLLTKMNRKEK